MVLKYDPEWAPGIEQLIKIKATAPAPALHDIESRRAAIAAMEDVMNTLPDAPDVQRSLHHTAAPDGHQVPIHAFQPKRSTDTPTSAILHIHGGGMIMCSVDLYARMIAHFVQLSGVPFFSVDYRLAPEFTNTTLVEDCYAGLTWLSQSSNKFNVDHSRIGVMGDSAGGGLSSGVALMARDRGLSPPLAKQILIYPMIDDMNLKVDKAIEPFAHVWANVDNITGWSALLGKDRAGKPDAEISEYCAPTRAVRLAGLPSTYIDVGNLDYFRDEDLKYAARIAAENVDVEFHMYSGVPHGFELFSMQSKVVRQAYDNRMKAIWSF